MATSSKDSDDDTEWGAHTPRRVKRVHILVLATALSFIAFLSHVANSSQREIRAVLSSNLEMQKKITSLSDTHTILVSEIKMMNDKIKKLEKNELEKGIPQHPLSKTVANSKEVSVTQSVKPKKAVKTVNPSSMLHPKIISRRMQSESNFTQSVASCDGYLFRLELQLDEWSEETSFTLTNIENGNVVENRSFSDDDTFADVTFETCLEESQYEFVLQDEYGDGISCKKFFEGKPCYDIHIDDVLTIPGKEYQSSTQKRKFDLQAFCVIGNQFTYRFNFDIEKSQAESISFIHKITDTQTNEDVRSFLLPDEDKTLNKTTFVQCIDASIYDVEFVSVPEINCLGPCYTVLVNDEIVVEGKEFLSRAFHKLFITADGIGREQVCQTKPLLAPINELNEFSFDDRASKILNVIGATSDSNEISRRDSSQYRATCYILYDDPLRLEPEDAMLLQRYALAVLFYSMNDMAEAQLPLDVCLDDKFDCNEQGEVIRLEIGGGGLNGYIPTEIGHLEHLETVILLSKGLGGTIPTEIARLTSLTILRLPYNELTGVIPTGLSTLPLEVMELGENNLIGSLPTRLGASGTLTIIRLYDNLLTGSIPSAIFESRSLMELDCDENLFSGSIPNEISQAELLEALSFRNNKLTGTIPPGFGNITELYWLDLGDNDLTGTIPPDLEQLTVNLEYINLHNNFLTGTLPNITASGKIYLHHNSLTGVIPESIFNSNITGLKLEDNLLVGDVPQAFCEDFKPNENVQGTWDLIVDYSTWFVDEPLVTCPCCDNSICYMWKHDDKNIVGGTRKPSCPKTNIFQKEYYERFVVHDDVTNATEFKELAWGQSKELDLCLSPTGCYSVRYDIVGGINDHSQTFDREYKLAYSSSSRTLVEQESCDVFEICGIPFGPEHPKRVGLNHLTHLVLPDLSFLFDSSLPEYKALCWIMTEDPNFSDFDVCDGTLMQRYVMVRFYYSFENVFDLELLKSRHTCEWPGVTCNSFNKFIEHLDFSGMGLKGNFVTEIGLLTRLKTFNLRDNEVEGEIDDFMFEYMPQLEIFDVSFNEIGGTVPKMLLQLPQIKDIVLSHNLFLGDLPKDIEYSNSIKKFDIENNLLVNFIPDALITSSGLEVINLSRNNLKGNIPPAIGHLENVREIHLHQNNLSGSLPVEIFNLRKIERFEVQSNHFTGLIHEEISNLQSATFISLSHNSFKGEIPEEIEKMKNLEFLHLHDNLLTGTAPNMPWLRELGKELGEHERYITDCGSPWYSLPHPLSCPSCTLCCNSDGLCQENKVWSFQIDGRAFTVTFAVPILFGILCYSVFKGFQLLNFKMEGLDTRDTMSFLDEDSAYTLIFCDNFLAWFVFFVVYILQGLFYYMFLMASSFTTISSDWQYTFQCPSTSNQCKNYSTVNDFGWIMFFVVTLCTLAVDYICSALQIRKAIAIFDWRLFISGFLHMSITVLALFCSYYYNMALGTTNTELIVNAVILLFVNDLDEQIMNALQALAPDWVDERIDEVKDKLTKKQRRGSVSSLWTDNKRRGSVSSQGSNGNRRFSLTTAIASFNKRRLSGASSTGWTQQDKSEIPDLNRENLHDHDGNIFDEKSKEGSGADQSNWSEMKLQEGDVGVVDIKE